MHIAVKQANIYCWVAVKNAKKQINAVIQYPDEYPSTPSMRLILLIIQTPARMLSGIHKNGDTICLPQSPWKHSMLEWLIMIYPQTRRISRQNLKVAERLNMSSDSPTINMMNINAIIPYKVNQSM